MMTSGHPLIDETVRELKEKLEPKLFAYLDKRDGATCLVQALTDAYSPEKIVDGSHECRAWELVGLYYLNHSRPHEALPIFVALYDHMLVRQQNGERGHKGIPLVWISECYEMMGFVALPKRYLMLTLIEDAIRDKEEISSETGGIYFRLVWRHGLPDSELRRYSTESYKRSRDFPDQSFYPEWILQDLDNNWITEFPTLQEAAVYSANTRYVKYLFDQLGDASGKTLERLAAYILSCMTGCRIARRKRSHSSEYDIVCSVDGLDGDFRSELGRYFVCECKDWQLPADFTSMAKFCRILDSTKCRFGILFSKKGISGQGRTVGAEREQLKVFQDRGMVIIVIQQEDIESVAHGTNFINLLRTKYERVRLDLVAPQ